MLKQDSCTSEDNHTKTQIKNIYVSKTLLNTLFIIKEKLEKGNIEHVSVRK